MSSRVSSCGDGRRLPALGVVAKMIDHSLLRPELTLGDVRTGCELAVRYDVASVCVRPADVEFAVELLAGSGVAVGSVVGFPHGASTSAAKVAEADELVSLGAEELDMVVNIGRLRSGDTALVGREIEQIVAVAAGRIVKVIFENVYLDDAEKVTACRLSESAGAAFVKTSTGFAPAGATAADVALMRASVSPEIGVKAAGGVRTLDTLLELHALGATRFGATATAAILDDLARRHGGTGAVATTVADADAEHSY